MEVSLLTVVSVTFCCVATLFQLPTFAALRQLPDIDRLASALPSFLLLASPVRAQPSGTEIMRRVNGRDAGRHARMNLHMTIVDERRRTSRELELELLRRHTPVGYRTRFKVVAPLSLSGLSLLLIEEDTAARLWLHFPSTKETTEIATRALSVLGSDFSCGDLRLTMPLTDYDFTNLGRELVDGHACWKIEMKPHTAEMQRQLGFGRAVGWVRDDALLIVRANFFDSYGQPFKTFQSDAPALIGGIWTLRRYSMANARTRHRTEVVVTAVDYEGVVAPNLVDPKNFGE